MHSDDFYVATSAKVKTSHKCDELSSLRDAREVFFFLYKINSLKKLVIGDCIIAKPSNGCTTRAKKFTRYLSFKLSCEEMRTRENNLAAVIKRSYLSGKVISASCDVD